MMIHSQVHCRIGAATAFILIAFWTMGATKTWAQQVDVTMRPSFSVQILKAPFDQEDLTLQSLRLNNSALQNRAFIDLVDAPKTQDLNITLRRLEEADDDEEWFAAKAEEWANRTGHARDIIEYLFRVDEDYGWSNDLLISRARYAQTEQEARIESSTVRGGLASAGDRALGMVTRAYSLILFPVIVEKEVKRKRDGKTITIVVKDRFVYGTLLKLPFATVDQVESQLASIYCDKPCSSPEIQRNMMSAKKWSMVSVWKKRVSLTDSQDLNDAIVDLVDDAIRNVPALQVKTFVVDDQPIRARIGKKDGVKRGRRYRAVRQVEMNGVRRQKHRGYVLAIDVADNTAHATRTTVTGQEQVQAFDTSVFKQVHGLKISPLDILVEKPDKGLNIMGAYRSGGYPSGSAEIAYRVPTSFAFLFGLGLELFAESAEEVERDYWWISSNDMTDWATLRGELFFAQEFMLMKGNIRIAPMFGAFYQSSAPVNAEDDEEIAISAIGGRASLMGSLMLTYNVGFFTRISYQTLGGAELSVGDESEDIKWSNYFDAGTGSQLAFGMRISL
jgi:hypothetical protein